MLNPKLIFRHLPLLLIFIQFCGISRASYTLIHPHKTVRETCVRDLPSAEPAIQVRMVQQEDSSIYYDTIRVIPSLKFDCRKFGLELVDPSSGIQIYKDGIVFLIDTKEKNSMYKVSFGSLDAYYAPVQGNSLGKTRYFSERFAFPFPTEAISFTGDLKHMYFTKYSWFKGSTDKKIRIYHSEYIDSQKRKERGWSDKIEEISFGEDNFSCLQPAVSPDGQILVFASEMDGGYGQLDLYLSGRNGESWSEPVNLGGQINTAGNESFPCFFDAHTLFFSSNGLPGYGGYDIYMIKWDDRDRTAPVNLGQPLNAPSDEVAFRINNKDLSMAFVSSNRNLYKKKFELFETPLLSGENVLLMNELNEELITRVIIESNQPALVSSAEITSATAMQDTASGTSLEEQPPADLVTFAKDKTEKEKTTGVIPPPAPAATTKEAATQQKIQSETTEKPKEIMPEEKQAEQAVVSKDEDEIRFRVQIMASVKSLGNSKLKIEGKEYDTFEYYYKGAYRYTIGEFRTSTEAVKFQKICRQAGYNEAFVAAFRNNERTLDREVFEKYR